MIEKLLIKIKKLKNSQTKMDFDLFTLNKQDAGEDM